MGNSLQRYSYQPLDKDSVRLVTIKRGSWDSIIECEVDVKKLGQGENRFRALSYVWGDSNIRRTIRLNGYKFEVTVNLFEGLRQIRRSIFEDASLQQLPIWIDAICINQDDKEEKAKQVPEMYRIYNTAEQVLLWLGVMPIPSDFLKPWTYDDRYSWIGFDDKDCPMSEQLRKDALERYVKYIRSPEFPIQVLSRQPTGRARKEQLMHFAVASALRHSTYFQRLWTVQEAVLAKNEPAILVNHHVLRWDEFTHKDRLEPEESVDVSSRPHTSFLGISTLRKQRDERDPRTASRQLLRVIQEFSELACTEAVDKIYGLLAMLPLRGLPPSLWPDYSIPCEEVYWRYAKHIFAKTGSLALLDRYTKPLPGVPSWVPAIGTSQQTISAVKSSALSNSDLSWWMYPRISADSRDMTITGFNCGVCIDRMERPLTVSRPEDLELVGTSIDLRDTMKQLEKRITAPQGRWGGELEWGEVTRTGIHRPKMSHPKSSYRKSLFELAQSLSVGEMEEFCSGNEDLAARALHAWREIAAFAWTSLRTSKGEIFTFRDSLWLDDFQPRKGDHIFKPNGMESAVVLRPVANRKFRLLGRLTTYREISNSGENINKRTLI